MLVPALNQSYGACGCGPVVQDGQELPSYLDMSDTAQQCPLNWTLTTSPRGHVGNPLVRISTPMTAVVTQLALVDAQYVQYIYTYICYS